MHHVSGCTPKEPLPSGIVCLRQRSWPTTTSLVVSYKSNLTLSRNDKLIRGSSCSKKYRNLLKKELKIITRGGVWREDKKPAQMNTTKAH